MADLSTHLMLDDANTAILFANAGPAFALAGYVNGKYANWPAIRKAYPTKHLVSITVSNETALGAQVLDIETGDAVIADAPGWTRQTQAAGHKAHDLRWYPKLYTSISNGADLLSVMERAGIARDEYMLWSAHYTYQAHICGPKTCGAAVQADATQWTDRYLGVSLDASLCYGYFFSGPPGKTKPTPKHKKGPVRHVADGSMSLDTFLSRAHLGLKATLDTSSDKLSDRHLRRFIDYLANGSASLMPKGLVFWTER